MASFFGFGRKQNDNEIPLSSSHRDEDEPSESPSVATNNDPPPLSPRGPPPTNPSYVIPSPSVDDGINNEHVSPLRDSCPGVIHNAAIENVEMPNIHIFNPAAEAKGEGFVEQQQLQQTENSNEMNTNAINPINSYDFYGAEEQQQQQQQQQLNYYHQDELQQPQSNYYQDELQPQSATAMESRSLDVEEDQEPVPVASKDDDEYPYHDENLQAEQEEEPQNSDAYYSTTDRPNSNYHPVRETLDDFNGRPAPSAHLGGIGNRNRTHFSTPLSSSPSLSGSPSLPGSRFRTPLVTTNTRKKALYRINTSETTRNLEEDNNKLVTPTKSPLEEIFTPQFKEIHSKTVRRRQTRQQNMQDLERRLASITSGLANITMDRESEMCHFIRDHICTPMEQVSEKLAMERDYRISPHYAVANRSTTGNATAGKHWMSITARLSGLETDMTHYNHVEIQNLKREKLDQPHNELTQEILPAFQTETRKSEKREGGMLRAFEAVAATARRRYHEERAARYAAFETLKQSLLDEAKFQSDPARIEEAITKVKALRAKLDQERVERRMRDEHLKTAIEQETISMKRALLESSGGDDIVPENAAADSVRRTIAYH